MKFKQNYELVVLAIVFFGAMLIQPYNSYAQDQIERVRDKDGIYFAPGANVTYTKIAGIPTPISRVDIERWSHLMYLSDEQKDQFRILHKTYIDQEAKVHWEHIQPLWNHSADISRRGGPSSHVVLAEEFSSLIKTDRPRAVKNIVSTENRLFNEFEVYLEEDQQILFKQVRSQRERYRYNQRQSRYPGGDVDLTLLLWKLYGTELELTGEQHTELQLLVSDYDNSITSLFKQRLDAILNLSIKGSVIDSQLRTPVQAGAKDLWNSRKRLNKKLVLVEKRIHDQNVRYLHSMLNILPDNYSSRISEVFNQLVYNSIYPDPTNTKLLFDAVFAIDLTVKQQEDLQAIKILIDSKQEKLCIQMEEIFLDWREFHGIEWGYPMGALEEYESDMFILHNKRKENAQFAITLINATILPEQKTERLISTTDSLVSRMQDYELIPDKRLSRR